MRKNVVLLALLIAIGGLHAELVTNELRLISSVDWADLSEAEMQTGLGYEWEYSTEMGLELFWETELAWQRTAEESDYLFLSSQPQVERGWGEMWNMGFAIPLYFNTNLTDEFSALGVGLVGEISYGNLQEDLAGISFWESYESGYNLALSLERSLYEEIEAQQIADDSLYLKAEMSYAFFQEKSAYMVKPLWGYRRQLNSNEMEEYELFAGLEVYKDLNQNFTLGGGLNYLGYSQAESDVVNSLDLGFELIYFPQEKLELSIGGAVTKEDLSLDDDPSFNLGIGLAWQVFSY
jgi:hypothetical protein